MSCLPFTPTSHAFFTPGGSSHLRVFEWPTRSGLPDPPRREACVPWVTHRPPPVTLLRPVPHPGVGLWSGGLTGRRQPREQSYDGLPDCGPGWRDG
jgi:hypothetical protein